MLEENTRFHPLFKSILQFIPVEVVPMPREGKMGKVSGVVPITSGLEDRSGGFVGKA
jgi:hypothetical protein